MKKHKTLYVLASFLAALHLVSCGKIYDRNGADWEADTPISDSVFNRDIVIKNLTGDDVSFTSLMGDPILFSFEKFQRIALPYQVTDRWDIAYGGVFYSQINTNNGRLAGLGYGSSAVGAVAVVMKPYSEVNEVPDDHEFKAAGYASLDELGGIGFGYGHVAFTFEDNMFRRDKIAGLDSPDPLIAAEANKYLHILYPLSEDFVRQFPYTEDGKEVKPRTFIFRTAKGNYVKFETISYYKNIYDPMDMKRGIPYAYSFRYMAIKNDERRFGFVERRTPMELDLNTGKKTIGEINKNK